MKYLLFFVALLGQSVLFAQEIPGANKTVNDEQLAFQFYQKRDFANALPIFEELHETRNNSNFYPYLLQCLIELKELKSAEKLVKKELRKYPNQLRYKADLGYVYNYQGESKAAEREFRDAIDGLEKYPQEVHNLAASFRMKMMNEKALEVYLKAQKVLGNTDSFGFEIASVYEAMGEFKKMCELYLDIVGKNPQQISSVQSRFQYQLSQFGSEDNSEYLRRSLISRHQKNPDAVVFSELIYWYAVLVKDYELAYTQAVLLVRKAVDNGSRLLSLGRLAYEKEEFALAENCFTDITRNGRNHPLYFAAWQATLKMKVTMARNRISKPNQDYNTLENDYLLLLDQMGFNPRSLDLISDLAWLRVYILKKDEEGRDMLRKALEMPGLSPIIMAGIRSDLASMCLYSGDPWEAAILYAQSGIEIPEDPAGQEARYKSAWLTYLMGEFDLAKSQLNILRGTPSRLVANEAFRLWFFIRENTDPDSTYTALQFFARAELHAIRENYDSAIQSLDSIKTSFLSHPIFDDILVKKAEIKTAEKKFEEAEILYQQLFTNYPQDILTDKALLNWGILCEEKTRQNSKAIQAFEKLITSYPQSIYIPEATNRLTRLRQAASKTHLNPLSK